MTGGAVAARRPGPLARAREGLLRLLASPNPVWKRELCQASRLGRTPILLATLTILMTLVISAAGGFASVQSSPAETGVVTFHLFFSLAYFVVTLLGPALAANSIASEREGRTWEAVLLTGLSPAEIARGKFLAAYTSLATYVVMLAPVGAVAFLFGGVTAVEVILAFVLLFVIALVAVSFGLAVSSKMTTVRSAIVVSILLAAVLAFQAFLALGVWFSFAAHERWAVVPGGPPIWLPAALARAPLDLDYVIFLLLLPATAIVVPAWFLHEVTIANLSGPGDDRSSGLRRWYLAALPLLAFATGAAVVTVSPSARNDMAHGGVGVVAGVAVFAAFLFAGEPLGPTRQVLVRWERARAGRLRRFLGPGVIGAALLQLAVASSVFLALALVAVLAHPPAARAPGSVAPVIAHAGSSCAFVTLLVGLGAYLRARAASGGGARRALVAIAFGLAIVPYFVALLAYVVAGGGDGDAALPFAAPSPFFTFVLLSELQGTSPSPAIVASAIAASSSWAGAGLALLGLAARRCRSLRQAPP